MKKVTYPTQTTCKPFGVSLKKDLYQCVEVPSEDAEAETPAEERAEEAMEAKGMEDDT
jgi:hypothetical protein